MDPVSGLFYVYAYSDIIFQTSFVFDNSPSGNVYTQETVI